MTEGPIAIVGASCRFPGAAGLEALWRLLIDGVDAVSEVGPDRWSQRFFYHPTSGEPGKTHSWAAGLIDGIDQFEPEFFGISPREAAEMDPQQRLLLELAWHALEDAGIPASRLAGTQSGVFIGASSTDYGDLRLGDPASAGPHFLSGSTLSILANRLSHVFDLRRPSQVIDTACSSSLVALHAACEALRSGEVEAALVGGVNLLLSPYPFIGFAQAGMLSRQGRCFAFDARADGYVRGEGGAVVVLKPLAQAIADRNPIRVVIRGTAVNASGRTIGLSLPNAGAQADLLWRIYAETGTAPDALGFVEMHGTGTPAGDPAEAEAVGQVLGQARRRALPIGSVKTNIGHLEPASGMAGLLKAMLALEHGELPRSLHGETPNPAIAFDRLNLRLVGAAEPLDPGACAGVNSFGFGGSNAHAILAPPPAREGAMNIEAAPTPLMISARSSDALCALVREWRDTIAVTPPQRLPLIARAAARRRDHHQHRLVVLGNDPTTALGDFLADRPNPAAVVGADAREGRLAFVYSGNGAQFCGMGQEAYRVSAAFRDAIADVDRALRPHLDWAVRERILGDITEEDLRRADIAQPMLFAIQVAITSVLRGLGVDPCGFVGHSVGEIAAAWAAGALSLDAAARVVAIRSRHQERTRGVGRMAVLAVAADEAVTLLGEIGDGLEIAAINGARSVTIAGSASAVSRLGEEAARRGLAWRPLELDFAFHSVAMEPLRADLIAELGDISSAAPIGDLVSTVTGTHVLPGALDAGYWWRNIRDPVCFATAIETLIADGCRIFAEIGPSPILLSYLREALHAAEPVGNALATLDRRDAPGDPFPIIAARLHVAGCDMSRAAWLDGPDDPRGLPLYPWQRQRFWFGRTVEAIDQTNPRCDHPLLGFRQPGSVPGWVNQLDTTLFPFLADHRVEGTPILPGAAVIEMALAAARTRYPDASALELRDVELLRPIVFDRGARETQCTLLPDGAWQLASRPRLADEALALHARAAVVAAAPDRRQRLEESGDVREVVGADTLYRLAAQLGLGYGDSFRTIEEVRLIDEDCAVVKLRSVSAGQDWLLDPAAVDGAFQGLLALLCQTASNETGFLPRRFGRITAIAPFGRAVTHAQLRLTRHGARSVAADIVLYDAAKEAVAALSDCWFTRVDRRIGAELLLHTALVPAPLEPQAPAIFDRIPEIIARGAAGLHRDPAREAEQALLFEGLLGAIARETGDHGMLPETLLALEQRLADLELPPSGELWRLLLADHPEMTAELALAAMLRDGQRIDVALPMIASLLQGSPSAIAGRAVLAAALDEIAAAWPRDCPLRVHEPGTAGLSDRLRSAGVAVISTAKDALCELALLTDAVDTDVARVNLAPGGVLLAVTPRPSPLWELLGRRSDGRSDVMTAGFSDFGSVPVSDGCLPREVLVGSRARSGVCFGIAGRCFVAGPRCRRGGRQIRPRIRSFWPQIHRAGQRRRRNRPDRRRRGRSSFGGGQIDPALHSGCCHGRRPAHAALAGDERGAARWGW
jgi:phthiocerol/phenolphthiocerol synthesis type-I polyketide synthase C